MSQTLRVSLPGYNALTDTNVDHYALYADSDNILIKEKASGSFSVGAGNVATIAHNLGYIPFSLAYGIFNTVEKYTLYGLSSGTDTTTYCDATNIYIENDGSSTVTGKYYIFYDNGT